MFGEGKATTENMSIFGFIWPLSLRVFFFCIWITLSGVWVHWLMQVNHLSLDKAKSFSGFVTLFCYWVRFVIFTQIFLFSSVNNLSTTYPDTFPHLIIRVCSKNQNGTVTFMNFGCLSNDDGEGKENVLSYQMNARFFLTFSLLFPIESWGPHPISDSKKKQNLSLC